MPSNIIVCIVGSQHCKDSTGEDDGQLILHDDDEAAGVMELDAELEDDLCKLWDASINEVRKLIIINFCKLPVNTYVVGKDKEYQVHTYSETWQIVILHFYPVQM